MDRMDMVGVGNEGQALKEIRKAVTTWLGQGGRLIQGGYNLDFSGPTIRLRDGPVTCPVGAFLLGKPSRITVTVAGLAAEYLGVPSNWVMGVICGFDGAILPHISLWNGEDSSNNEQWTSFEAGHATGEAFREEFKESIYRRGR